MGSKSYNFLSVSLEIFLNYLCKHIYTVQLAVHTVEQYTVCSGRIQYIITVYCTMIVRTVEYSVCTLCTVYSSSTTGVIYYSSHFITNMCTFARATP